MTSSSSLTTPVASATEWPELETTSTIKAPEWTLRTESELHIERLEAKLDSIKKKNNRKASRDKHLDVSSQEPLDLDSEEIQAGQEEADEGLWLLWNAASSSIPPSESESQKLLTGSNPMTSYGSSSTKGISTSYPTEVDGQDGEREERLETAKAKAKHVEEYTKNDSRTCCCSCIIA
ncbi:hypothetical protein BGZ49_008452 [Haplosporangium sp. Z 27]|nr:hypothetical protein BGZ49_008452 [Haplosporangium sp. Z 27]